MRHDERWVTVLVAADEGNNLMPLIELLRSEFPMSFGIRELLADLLETRKLGPEPSHEDLALVRAKYVYKMERKIRPNASREQSIGRVAAECSVPEVSLRNYLDGKGRASVRLRRQMLPHRSR